MFSYLDALISLPAQPLHWVYDQQKLSDLLSQVSHPEFRPESANPFYRRETGNQSCYGDQAYVLLESLSECKGNVFIHFGDRLWVLFVCFLTTVPELDHGNFLKPLKVSAPLN